MSLAQRNVNVAFDFTEELRKLPAKPGVYLMRNADSEIIYVGKAVSLKNRVRQYFQSGQSQSDKVRAMVAHIASFEYIVTDSEFEALILECNLIKKNRPKYNVLLKDDKHYPYIKVTLYEEYPRVIPTRRVSDDGARYFGPYLNVHSITDTIYELRKVFPMKSCKREFPKDIGKGRPCLNHHIGLCSGPCTGDVDRAEYTAGINDICQFLDGRQDDIVRKLETMMYAASEDMNFELAGKLRDRLFALRHVQQKQKVLSTAEYDQDVIAHYSDNIDTCIAVFFIRGGKLVGKEQYLFDGVGMEDCGNVVSGFLKQFYEKVGFIPREILLSEPVDDLRLIETMLRGICGSKVDILVPVRGEKRHMVMFAAKNAEVELNNKRETMRAEELRLREGLRSLAKSLDIELREGYPFKIEAYDISNYGTDDKVASMVCFLNGRPQKSAYRRFKIAGVAGQDDYACMREALLRRLKRLNDGDTRFAERPDVILVDGGSGHISTALGVIKDMEMSIPVAGMVKNDRHETSSLLSYDGEDILLSQYPELHRLVSSIQDEAHRFAIEYSRKLAGRRLSLSALDNIRGVGKKRKMALLTHFKSFKNIKAASVDELKTAPGMDIKTAGAVYEYFHTEDQKSET